jgi:hypothetical protein
MYFSLSSLFALYAFSVHAHTHAALQRCVAAARCLGLCVWQYVRLSAVRTLNCTVAHVHGQGG